MSQSTANSWSVLCNKLNETRCKAWPLTDVEQSRSMSSSLALAVVELVMLIEHWSGRAAASSAVAFAAAAAAALPTRAMGPNEAAALAVVVAASPTKSSWSFVETAIGREGKATQRRTTAGQDTWCTATTPAATSSTSSSTSSANAAGKYVGPDAEKWLTAIGPGPGRKPRPGFQAPCAGAAALPALPAPGPVGAPSSARSFL